MSLSSHVQFATSFGVGGQQPVLSNPLFFIPSDQSSPIRLNSSALTESSNLSKEENKRKLTFNSFTSTFDIKKLAGNHLRKTRQVPDYYYHQQHQNDQQQQQPDYDNENFFYTNQVISRGRFNQHKNKKPVYVSINQETVNGLLSLLLLFVVSICGCIGTILIISSLTVIESLQTRGNCYLVSLALAHLLVTLLVMPTSALQIMAGDGIDGRRLCHYQWLILEFSLMVSQLSFLLIAIDSYLGYKSSEKVILPTLNSRKFPILDTNELYISSNISNKNPPSSSLCKHANEAASRPRSSSYVSLINTGARVNITSGNQQLHSEKDAQQQQQQKQPQQVMNPSGGQKLSLARQFADEPGVKVKQASSSCLSYGNCCGRLKVLVWILAVWFLAISYTFHEHELRYGANFCNYSPSSVAKKGATQNLSIVSHTINAGKQNLQQQQLQRDSLVTGSTDFEGSKKKIEIRKREVSPSSFFLDEKLAHLSGRKEANSAGSSLEQPSTKVSRVTELEILEGKRMKLSESQLRLQLQHQHQHRHQSRGDHLEGFLGVKRRNSGDGVVLLSGRKLARRSLNERSLEVPLGGAIELPAGQRHPRRSQRMRSSTLELEGAVHHYYPKKKVFIGASTFSFSNQHREQDTWDKKLNDDQVKQHLAHHHEQEPDGWFAIESSGANKETSTTTISIMKKPDDESLALSSRRFLDRPNDGKPKVEGENEKEREREREKEKEKEEVGERVNVRQTSRDYEKSSMPLHTTRSSSVSSGKLVLPTRAALDAVAYLSIRTDNEQLVSERQDNEKNEFTTSFFTTKISSNSNSSSSLTDSFGQARQQLMFHRPFFVFATNLKTHYDSYHRNKGNSFSHELDIHIDNVTPSDTIHERDNSDSLEGTSSVLRENASSTIERQKPRDANDRQLEVELENVRKSHYPLNHHLTLDGLFLDGSLKSAYVKDSSSSSSSLFDKDEDEDEDDELRSRQEYQLERSSELENKKSSPSIRGFQQDQLKRTYLDAHDKVHGEKRKRLMNNNNNNNALGMQIASKGRKHFASVSSFGKLADLAGEVATTREASTSTSRPLTNHSGAQSHFMTQTRRTNRAANRRIIKLPPTTTPNSNFPEPAKLMASPPTDSPTMGLSSTLGKQESVNQLTTTTINTISSSSIQQLPSISATSSGQMKLETTNSGKAAVDSAKWHWIILIGSTVIPSLFSAILFTKAYFRMKEFKVRPYEPMPINMPTSILFNFLASLPKQPPLHNNSATNSQIKGAQLEKKTTVDTLELPKQNNAKPKKSVNGRNLTFEQPANNQSIASRAADSSSAPELLTKLRVSSSNQHPNLSALLPVRAELPISSPENLKNALQTQHRQVNQVMSAPINSQLMFERPQGSHQRLQSHTHPHPHPHSSSSLISSTGHEHWPQLTMSSQLIESQQQRLERNASHSAPPRQINPTNIGVAPDNLAPNSNYYQFKRRQHHAQSFHYGSSSLATSNPSYTRPSQPITLSRPNARLENPEAADYQLLMQDGQINQTSISSQQQQHLLERRRSLPRSSRLYQPADVELTEPAQALISNASSTRSTQLHYQQLLRQHKPADSGIKQTTNHPASSEQLKQAHLDALANVIKSMDDSNSHSLGAQFNSASRQQADKGEQETNKAITSSVNLSSQPASPRTRLASGGSTIGESNQQTAVAQPATTALARGIIIGNSSSSSSNSENKMSSSNGKSRAILCTYSYMADDQLLKSNIIVFIVNLTLWFPFIILSLVSQYRDHLTQELKDSVWWMATLNCCSCSYVYALTNKDFREAFNKLFYYCCCKSHVTFQKKTPIFKRQIEIDSDSGDVRVRVFPGLNLYSNKLSALKGADSHPSSHFPHHQYSSSHSPAFSGDFSSNYNHFDHNHHQTTSNSHSHSHSYQHHNQHQHTQNHHAQQNMHRHLHMSVGGGFGGPLFGQPTGGHSSAHTHDRMSEL